MMDTSFSRASGWKVSCRGEQGRARGVRMCNDTVSIESIAEQGSYRHKVEWG